MATPAQKSAPKLEVMKRKSSTLEFPIGLVQNNTPYIRFSPYDLDIAKMIESPEKTIMGDFEGNEILKPFPGIGPICLPLPNAGIQDSTTHNWELEKSALSKMADFAKGILGKAGEVVEGAMKKYSGTVLDPGYVQAYNGTAPRQWSCSYIFLPETREEAQNLKTIISYFKRAASPRKGQEQGSDKTTHFIMKHPAIFKVEFLTGANKNLIHNMLNFKPLALTSFDLGLFTNGYPTSFDDGFPKQITLALRFVEFGVRYSEDWEIK